MTVTLITGTSSGIGQATALHLARQGYHVYASMRNPASGSAPLVETARREDLRLEVIRLDVDDEDSSERAVREVLERAGRIDALVNNAGIAVGGPLEEVPDDQIRAVFETNFFGAMRLMRLVVPVMRHAQSGAIINVTSIMGRLARAGGSAYAASKFALEAASEALAQEVHRFNIRVAIIEPGVVRTRLHAGDLKEPDPASPYREFDLRGNRLFARLRESASPPERVAETIQHALETDQPRLRYLVGEDAERWAIGRRAMTDETWVDVGREMTLDEYAAFYLDSFGMSI